MFPAIPQWIGRIFPTYYIIAPIVETTQRAAQWSDIGAEVGILCALTAALALIVAVTAPRLVERES